MLAGRANLLLLKVPLPMYLHVVATIELLAALGASVRLLTVHVAMSGQMTRLREIRAAFLTHVLAQAFVLQQVLVEKCLGRVTIVADVTHKRFGIGVLQHVSLIFGSDLKGLAARVARVRGRVTRLNVLVQHR